jgi:L-lactate dehydrogenase complex protein LldE
MDVRLFIPCFIDQLYPETAFNTIKVLERAGCRVNYNPDQTCCGQPAFNAGYRDESRAVCSKFLHDFSGEGYIVTPSASCAGFVRNYYPALFENSSLNKEVKAIQERIFELSDFLVNILKVTSLGARFEGKVTYHDSCAALRECKIKQEPRTLLKEVTGLELTEMNDVETCCGFGGTFAVKFEAISVAMGDQKSRNANDTGAQYLVSTDMSCLMHISGVMANKNSSMRCMHLADVLASGY